jgi:hypothetical protein
LFWIARVYAGKKKYRMRSLGLADDYRDADGRSVLTYFQAAKLARECSAESPDVPPTVRANSCQSTMALRSAKTAIEVTSFSNSFHCERRVVP